MKKAYIKVLSIVILVMMVLTLAGCEQISQLQSLLPGAQTEAPVAESGEEETGEEESGPVSGDISELQGSKQWVYLVNESAEKGTSPTGILIYNPALGGYNMNGVTGTEAYIEWDGREFDLDTKDSRTSEGWYYSVQLATNIRNENFVLRLYLLRDEAEPEEIQLENPTIAVLEWPSLMDKNGISMQKTGSTYTFSAENLKDILKDTAPGVFSYRIKDCTDCNVQLDGDTLQYKSISSNKASFTVEISDPAGVTKEVQIGISRTRNMSLLLIPLVMVVIAAIAVLLIAIKIKKTKEKYKWEALGDVAEKKDMVDSCLADCNSLFERVENVENDEERIVKDIINTIIQNIKNSVETNGYYKPLGNYTEDLGRMAALLEYGRLEDDSEVHTDGWTRKNFLNKAFRDRELNKISENIDKVNELLADANDKMDRVDEYRNLGNSPFGFGFEISVNKDNQKWTCAIEKGEKGRQRMGSRFFDTRSKDLILGKEILTDIVAAVEFFSLNSEKILIYSDYTISIADVRGDVESGENYIVLKRGDTVRFTVTKQQKEESEDVPETQDVIVITSNRF